MKRMICALLALTLLFGLAGCKKDAEDQLEVSQEETTLEPETEEWTEETTEEPTEEETTEETTEETEATVVPCENHTWGEWVRWEKSSTTTEGKRVRTCVVCGEEDVEIEPTLPKTTNHTHKYKVEKSAATCLEDGWAYYYCTCGDWYQVTLKATGHKWGSWKFTKIPTETARGLKVRICESCKEREEEETPSFKEHTHKYYKFENEATCTKAGAEGELCSVCGYSNPDARVTIPALGHKWGSWKVTKEATEDAKGVETRTCKRCSTKETRSIDKLPHTTHKWETAETVAPTCEKDGYTLRRCKICKQEEKVDVIPATGHTYEWKVTQEPGCEKEGEEAEVCTVCGAQGTSRPLPALDHDWSDWETDEENETKQTRTCKSCGTEESRDKGEGAGE